MTFVGGISLVGGVGGENEGRKEKRIGQTITNLVVLGYSLRKTFQKGNFQNKSRSTKEV